MSESNMTDLAKDYAGRASTNPINFGIRKIKKLKVLTHWCKDHRRTSTKPTVEATNGITFNVELIRALQRAQICKQLTDDSSKKAKASSPGPLESEDDWISWETKFVNYILRSREFTGYLYRMSFES